MIDDIKNIFNFIIIFQCLLFSIYLFTDKGPRRTSNILLALFLLTRGISEIGGVFINFTELKEAAIIDLPYIMYFPLSFNFLYVPFLYLYIRSITEKNFSLRKKDFGHFVLSFGIFLTIILYFIVTDPAQLRENLKWGCPFFAFETWMVRIAEYIQFITYAIASIYLIKRYREEIKNEYSSIEKINLSWLSFLLFGFIAWNALRITEIVARSVISTTTENILYIIAEITFISFISVIFLKGLRQPQIFSGDVETQSGQKYEKTLLTKEELGRFQEKLKDYVEREKPYLQPTLSLAELSSLVSIPQHDLSQVLNLGIKQNFFDFINYYRIEESKFYLSEPSQVDKSIMEIMLLCGFNSKSSFNNAFKKFTDETPSQFRSKSIKASA